MFDLREKIIAVFRDYSFLLSEAKYKVKYGKGLEMLTPKYVYSLYRAKEITKNVYNNIINSIKLQKRMNTIFMNSRNSKISDPHRLFINLSDKINSKETQTFKTY